MNQIPKNGLTGLIVSNPSDFKAVYENFQTLLCSYLTKQEIEMHLWLLMLELILFVNKKINEIKL